MQKVKDFLKNYRKILLMSLVCLIALIAISSVIFVSGIMEDVEECNVAQLEKTEEKSSLFDDVYDQASDLILECGKKDISILYRLYRLEPADLKDPSVLQNYCDHLAGANSVCILDKNKAVTVSYGDPNVIDYTDPSYADLFQGGEGEYRELMENGETGLKLRAVKIGSDFILVQTDTAAAGNFTLDRADRWTLAFDFVGLHCLSSYATVRISDNTVIRSGIPALEGTVLTFAPNTLGVNASEDGAYFVQSRNLPDEGVCLVALTRFDDIYESCRISILILSVLSIISLAFLIIFVILLRQGELDPRQEYSFLGKFFLHTQTKRFRAFSLCIGFVLTFLFLVLSNMEKNYTNRNFLAESTTKYTRALDKLYRVDDKLSDVKQEMFYDYGRIVDFFTDRHDSYLTKQGMAKLALALDVEYATVFDAEGKTLCTSASLDHLNILDDPDSQLYELRYALMGKEGVCVSADAIRMNKDDYIYAVPRRNAEGIADGVIALTTLKGISTSRYETLSEYADILRKEPNLRGDTLVFTLLENGTVVNDADGFTSIRSAEDLGLSEETLKDGFNGIVKINKKNYLASVSKVEYSGNYVYMIMLLNCLSKLTVVRCLAILLLYLLASVLIWYDGLGSKYHFERRDIKQKDADEWQRTEPIWEELSTTRKLQKILDVFFIIVGLIVIIASLMIKNGYLEDFSEIYLVSMEWQHSINLYSILSNLLILCCFYSVTRLLVRLLNSMESVIGTEVVTTIRLIRSIIKYVSTIACVVVMLTNFGVDAITTLASLGIIGLALTFGAQDLVKDVLAGMFLLFEGHFKVGDMISYNGNWYWVQSIGVRTTTLEAWGQICVVNNAKMSNVINLQNASSTVNCDIKIDSDSDLDFIEKLMRENLPQLKQYYSADVSTPVYKGVRALSGSGITVRVTTYCKPLDDAKVGGKLRQQLKQIFDENGIRLAPDSYVVTSTSISKEELKKEMDATM